MGQVNFTQILKFLAFSRAEVLFYVFLLKII